MYLFSIHVFDRHLHYTPFKGNTTQIEIGGDRAIFPFGIVKKFGLSFDTSLFARKRFYYLPILDLYRGHGKIKGYHHEQPDHIKPRFQLRVS